MIKGLLLVIGMVFSMNAGAFDLNRPVVPVQGVDIQIVSPLAVGLGWIVGETTDHNLNMGFITGTMHTVVREETDQGFWMQQNVDMAMGGEQVIEILLDKNTGEILKLIVNGKEEAIPERPDMEVVEAKEATLTVPAGTFECAHFLIRNKKDNSESQMWINPSVVPMQGLLKSIQPGQFGEVILELTAYSKL